MFSVPLLPLTYSLLLPASVARGFAELNILRVLDHLFAFRQPDVRFLPVAAKTLGASPAAKLAVKNRGAHVIHFHFENALHGFLDFRFGGVLRYLKDHGVLR